jgi:agmatine/peptidylarginine deiminase
MSLGVRLQKVHVPTRREKYRQAVEFLTAAQIRDIRLAMNDAWDRRLADNLVLSEAVRLMAEKYGVGYGTIIKAAYMTRR